MKRTSKFYDYNKLYKYNENSLGIWNKHKFLLVSLKRYSTNLFITQWTIWIGWFWYYDQAAELFYANTFKKGTKSPNSVLANK